MKEKKFLDDFFFYSSKIILVVPFILILLALVLKFNQNKKNQNIKNKQVVVTPTIPQPSPSVKKNLSIDLQGPLVCQLNDKEASISAYIKNKNIYAKITKKEATENFLLNKDCLYHWLDKQYTGEKICGLSGYINLLTNFSSFDLFSLFKDNKDLPIKDLGFDQLASFCQKKEVDDVVFEVPQVVIFKNRSL